MSVAVSNAGHFQIPTAPAAGTSVTSGTANAFTGTAVVLSASTSAMFITGVHVESSAALAATYVCVQLMQGGAGSETSIGQYNVPLQTGSTVALGFHPIYPPIKVSASTRLSVKTADSVGSKATLITVECVLQSNVVDDGIAGGTVATVTNQLTAAQIATGVWQDTTAGDFTTALSVGKSLMNGVALGTGLTINGYTGNTVQTGDAFAIVKSGGTGDNAAIKTKTDNLPASPASTTNITAGTIATVTTLTNLPSIPANWLTAAGIAANALNGKGDWLLSSGYTAPTNLTAAQIATGVWQDTTAGDFTASLSIGKSVMNGVTLGTGLTINALTGNTVQTGDAYARIGAAGAGLTAIGDTRIAHLDADVSSRASPTNITAGTITTVTNLTNAPTSGDLTSTMKTSVTTAATAATPTAAAVTGAVGSVTGLTASNLDATVSSRLASASYTAPPSAATIAAAVWAYAVEGTHTAVQYIRGFASALMGKASGLAGTAAIYRDFDDTKDRITATVDADGNRTALTTDLT